MSCRPLVGLLWSCNIMPRSFDDHGEVLELLARANTGLGMKVCAAWTGAACSACTATAVHILVMHSADAPDFTGINNSPLSSRQQVQSWSSSSADGQVCTQPTGFQGDCEPIAEWQDCGYLTSHNKHNREATLIPAGGAVCPAS